tara:strand:- start:42222 stop:43481 length:1260 start_codon:yes stop_codon:yes gene_type:complete
VARQGVQLYGDRDDVNDNIANVTAGNVHVTMGDSASLDSFSRQRVSQPVTIFDSILKYSKRDDLWYESLTGGATSVHSFDQASTLMTVTSSGDIALRQSRLWTRYQPGKSQLTLMTFVLEAGGPTTNVRRRVGHFHEDNGVFLEQTDTGIRWVKRTKTSGTVVDTPIEQADWNIDTYDDLDPTKTHILVVDLQWLGVGRVRVGFDVNGVIRYVHEFNHANFETTVYMTTAQLPLRYELEATGTPATPATMRVICAMVSSEGGVQLQLGVPHTANSGAPATVSGVLIPVLSIRPKATFEGEINRIQTIQRSLQLLNTGNGQAEVHLIWDAALTGASWASVAANSVLEFDTAATALTGGSDVQSFYVSATNQADASLESAIVGGLTLSVDILGANPTPLTIAVTNHGVATVAAAMSWQEYL